MDRLKIKIPYSFIVLPLVVLILLMQGCTTTPPISDTPLAFQERVESSTKDGVTVTVAVPTIGEAYAIYGVILALKGIQPVWIEVRNETPDTYWLLTSGLDPEYFKPSEAAFAFSPLSEKSRTQLVGKFKKLQFKNPVRPRSTESGFVLVNLDEGFKAVDIDLLSRNAIKNFSFIIHDPDFKADHKQVDFKTLYAPEEIRNIDNLEDLRRTIEDLPCCTSNADGDKQGDPLNLVLIGELHDFLTALIRRNWHPTEVIWSQALKRTIKSFLTGERYRYSPVSPLYVYGRNQDIAWQKARGTINERNHMRFWMSPLRFRGKPVFVGQISRDIGVKFTFKSPTISTHVIDPDVDEARRYFLEDMAYSQALARYGFAKGVGTVEKAEPRMNLVGDPYYTDGLRVVLFFEPRPYTLSNIDFLEWEVPPSAKMIYSDTP